MENETVDVMVIPRINEFGHYTEYPYVRFQDYFSHDYISDSMWAQRQDN